MASTAATGVRARFVTATTPRSGHMQTQQLHTHSAVAEVDQAQSVRIHARLRDVLEEDAGIHASNLRERHSQCELRPHRAGRRHMIQHAPSSQRTGAAAGQSNEHPNPRSGRRRLPWVLLSRPGVKTMCQAKIRASISQQRRVQKPWTKIPCCTQSQSTSHRPARHPESASSR